MQNCENNNQNDEKMEQSYPDEALNIPGKHYIILNHPEDVKDYIYIQKLIK